MARLWNTDVAEAVRGRIGGNPITAAEIVRITGLSYSAVRRSLKMLHDSMVIDYHLAMGLRGHAIRRWYWISKENAE